VSRRVVITDRLLPCFGSNVLGFERKEVLDSAKYVLRRR
jgi:hypothetical protein